MGRGSTYARRESSEREGLSLVEPDGSGNALQELMTLFGAGISGYTPMASGDPSPYRVGDGAPQACSPNRRHQLVALVNGPRPRASSLSRNRGLVHVALILGFLGAFVSLAYLTRHYFGLWGTTDHAIIGFAVLGFVLVHLWQRRRTVRRLISRLRGNHASTDRHATQAVSDMILWLLTLNVMASGSADYVVGHQVYLPIPGPYLLQRWHAMGVIVLTIYVIVHVVRRRKRLWRSRIT